MNLFLTFRLNFRKAILKYQICGLTIPTAPYVKLVDTIIEHSDELDSKREELEVIKEKLRKKKLLEHSIETQNQVAVKIILLILSFSSIKYETVLETSFGKEFKHLGTILLP